ncbi:MAG TPA: hypothetical protein PLF25_06670, partial [Accumulibacter sp.]|nr:hypothetical protein [Accumulibacter sp.]
MTRDKARNIFDLHQFGSPINGHAFSSNIRRTSASKDRYSAQRLARYPNVRKITDLPCSDCLNITSRGKSRAEMASSLNGRQTGGKRPSPR